MAHDVRVHPHHPCCGVSTDLEDYFLTRRQFLNRVGMGLGALSLAALLEPSELSAAEAATTSPLAPRPPHFPGKARAVIHIFAQGAPSHVDTWDPKPALLKMNGKTLSDGGVAMGSPFKFNKMGRAGIEVSELFAETGRHVDDMAIIRSMHTDIPAHDVATVFMNTGSLRIAKPSMGSWVVYGLGTENQNLPGFIALRKGGIPAGGAANYNAAFLPGVYQGTSVNVQAASVQQMIQNIRSQYLSKTEQRRQIDFVNELHARNLQREAVRHTDEDLQMPQKSEKLADNQIADLAEWVRRGAPYPVPLIAKGGSSAYGGVGREHWAFQPVNKSAVPVVDNADWCRTPVDNFILQKLEANGMAPNPPADKRTLIRRVTFDLTGLPPTDAEVDAFLADDFGAGIVLTPDDLGNMSSPPTHPELLDWLAATFMEQGWSIKQLHRLILLSSTYQESCAANPRYAELDPENKLHWRFNLRRLDFEDLHDALLAISDTLDGAVGGRSMNIGSADFAARRALYTYVDRANPPEIMTQFDFPNPNVPSGRRYETIVPQQSLFLMNGVLVVETARTLAHRPEFLGLQTDGERVTSLYLAIFQRPPTAEEIRLCLQYVKANPRGASPETPPENIASRMASRAAQMEARRAEMAMNYPRRRAAVQVEPGAAAFTTREPLDAWTKLAHSLLQSNEAMFLN